MDQQILTYVLLGGLAMALLVAAFTDLKSRRIANKLNLAIAAGAPFYWWASGLSLWPGVGYQIGIAVITFAVCALFFAIRQMGGGDVKLLTALALWFEPSNFLGLVLIMAMLGWVLTLVMGIWGVARSRVVGTRPVRDATLLVACTLVAANFASAVLGGPRLAMPAGIAGLPDGGTAAMLIAAMLPIAVLAVVTLASIRIIRRHDHQPKIPYGLAISMAGLWIVGGGILAGLPNPVAG